MVSELSCSPGTPKSTASMIVRLGNHFSHSYVINKISGSLAIPTHGIYDTRNFVTNIRGVEGSKDPLPPHSRVCERISTGNSV